MTYLKNFMSSAMFFDILSSLDYSNMNIEDKKFIKNLYYNYLKDKDDMEFSINQYARLNDIDFMFSEYILSNKYISHLRH